MAEPAAEAGGGEGGEEVEPKLTEETAAKMNRKEKRKAMKKMKRKQTRKEIALKEREEEDDPEEVIKNRMMEKEEAERSERERKLFEERERAWIEAMEIKKQQQLLEQEEEERRIKALQLQEEEELARKPEVENANDSNEADDWEYVEEGPAEIIWQGNDITVKKKRVKVPKRNADKQSRNKDPDRPTSNPLPPKSEAFSDYKNSSLSAQQLMENVAQQVPNFGTEQDKAHCPFHLKTGACRFGHRCSRVHFYPNKSCTLLIKNMYNGPGLAWEQDEVLEYNDEEVDRCFEEFYEDVHTEFLKYGEIINFKVCRNGAFHLRGNVYVHFKSIDSAVLAHESLNARYFAGKQISCEFINVTKWKVALCGEYMKSRYKTCSRGTACNFIHCFRNPGGDYEWADCDRPPPRYWVEKMVALFGSSHAYEKEMPGKDFGQLRNSSKVSISESKRYRSRRSRSEERDYSSFSRLDRKYDTESYAVRDAGHQRYADDDKNPNKIHDEDLFEKKSLKDHCHRKRRKCDIESGGEFSDKDTDRHHVHMRKSSRRQYEDRKNKDYRTESDGNLSDRERNRVAQHGCTRRSSSQHEKVEFLDNHGDYENKNHEVYGDWSERDNDRNEYHDNRRRSRQKRKAGYPDNRKDRKNRAHDTDEEWSDSHRKGYEYHNGKKIVQDICKATKESNHGERTTRVCSSQHSDGLLDSNAERYPTHARKQSKHLAEVSDTSDDDQVPTEQLKYRRDHLSTERRKGDSLVNSVKSDGNHYSLCQDDEKYRSRHLDMKRISDAHMHQEDRWEPEDDSVEIFHSSKRKAGSSDDHKSGRPGPCNGRDESSDSEVYSKDQVSREHRYESDQATPSKHRDSRRKSTDNRHKLDSKNR